MLKFTSIALLMTLSYACLGQAKPAKGNEQTNPYKKRIIVDVYTGDMPADSNKIATELTLQHKPGADEGAFTLKEAPLKGKSHNVVETMGDWTVLKGSATDENATVIELDGSDKKTYYLRRKDGKLQQLDNDLREMKPVKNYVLGKGKKTPAKKKKKKKK